MATYHFTVRLIKRSQNKSAVAAAAYRAGERYFDERHDRTWDYGNKQVAYSTILTPEHAGVWAKDRETLWNTVQNKERQWKNGQLARDVEIALPRELSLEKNIELIERFAQRHFVDLGMIADVNIHEEKASDGGMNPHAHIMLTMKALDENTGELKSAKERAWNKKALLKSWREEWANIVNEAYEKNGIEEMVDHRTLEEQGIDREPEIHVGFHAHDIEQKEGYSQRYARNEAIKERNTLAALARQSVEAFYAGFKRAVAWIRREEQSLSPREREEREFSVISQFQRIRETWREPQGERRDVSQEQNREMDI